ncbi:hypothetical protein KM043_013762 [Ampulex compressa]|nr:hypothetical protein KM043_013762 [Ampulex compressa]
MKKFWFNVMGRDDGTNENETDTEDEEITESDETASTEKRVRFLGIPFYKLFYKRLSKKCLKFLFLTLNGTILLKCCGIKSYEDWVKYRISVPQSCCWASVQQCLRMTENIIYKTGCLKGAVLLLKSHVHTVAITAVLLSLVLLLSLFLAVGVRKRFKLARLNPR